MIRDAALEEAAETCSIPVKNVLASEDYEIGFALGREMGAKDLRAMKGPKP